MAKKKIKIPKSVLDLRLSPKKFAKKNNIHISGKHMSKGEKKHNIKRLKKEYSEFAINGLNKAVKIVTENPDCKKIEKVKAGIENIITNPEVMKRIAKMYNKDREQYKNMYLIAGMIMNTLVYYNSDAATEEEKKIAESLNSEALIEFCEKILKKQIKRYKKFGLNDAVAFQFATVVPTTKLFKNRQWYKKLIQQMYDVAEKEELDVDLILKAVSKIDGKKSIDKKEFLAGFFSEFILQRNSNKSAKYTDSQKELNDNLVERALVYLNGIKKNKLKEILKGYIKCRKKAEEYKNDGKRVIKFTDHANSNSPYETIKAVVQELISENSSYEVYLS